MAEVDLKKAFNNEEMIMRMAEIFRMMGDVTRIKILLLLFDKEYSVREISNLLNLKISGISHQLRLLRSMRLVRYRRRGRNVYYTLHDEHVRALVKLACEHVSKCEALI